MGNSLTSGNKLYYQCSVFVLRTRHADGQQLLGTIFPPHPCDTSFAEPLGSWAWTETAAFISHFWKCCARVPSCCCWGVHPSHQSRTSPRHHRPTRCSSPRPALARNRHSSSEETTGQDGDWVEQFGPFSCSNPRTDQLTPTATGAASAARALQPLTPALLHPTCRALHTGNEIRNHEKRGHNVNQVQLRPIQTKPFPTTRVSVKSRGWRGKLHWLQVAEPLHRPGCPRHPLALQRCLSCHALVRGGKPGIQSTSEGLEAVTPSVPGTTRLPEPAASPVAITSWTPGTGGVVAAVAEQA